MPTLSVLWTERSLRNALSIRQYLKKYFSEKEVADFEDMLKSFEVNVANFPSLYPKSKKHPELRKAVLHKYCSVFYTDKENQIVVIAMQDNRQERPST